MLDLAGKVALVTGARQGMGKAHAIALAQHGATVILTDVEPEACAIVKAEIAAAGGTVQCFKMDVSKKSEVDQVFDRVIASLGRVDILVNNAGIYTPKPALDLTEDEWDRMLDVNLKGQFLCAQRAAKEMMKHRWGRIINIASIASGQTGIGIAGGAHYTASKGGILGMTETLAVEWAPHGILVNAVAPGAVDTPMASVKDMPKDTLEQITAKIPLRRFGRPEEVSALVVFLASEEASYITGATFYVDGGWLAA